MISFRFHIVSLTAVFLALAIGIGIGAGVVDRKTVDFLENRLKSVSDNRDATNKENDALKADRDQWRRFANEGAVELVRGRLDVPVLLVGVQGIDREPVDALRQSIVAAGGRLQGTVWFTSKLELGNPDDVRDLQAILGATTARPDTLRRAVAARLATSWLPDGGPSLLPALRDAEFVDYEVPEGDPVEPALVGAPGTYFVVVSAANPDLPNDQVAVPFTTTLAQSMPNRVLAAEPALPATDKQPEQRAVFLAPLRADANVGRLLSTVDNLEDIRGRIAAVLALGALADGRTGNYGVGRGTRSLPELSP